MQTGIKNKISIKYIGHFYPYKLGKARRAVMMFWKMVCSMASTSNITENHSNTVAAKLEVTVIMLRDNLSRDLSNN